MAATGGGETPAVEPPEPADDDVVITTVVSSDDARATEEPSDADDVTWAAGEHGEDIAWARDDAADARSPRNGQAAQLAAFEDRLAALESVPGSVDALGKAIRHELERCAGVLFGHDRALSALAARLDAVEAPGADPGGAPERGHVPDQAVGRIVDQLDRLSQRLGAMEARVEPLEPLPTIVQALRRAVRTNDDLIAGEPAAREQAIAGLAGQLAADAQARDDALRRLVTQDLERVSGIATAQAKGLADLAERLAAAEASLTPLASVPDDVAGLSRILRRELDAVVTDNQARDQMLRRALQNEIDQLRATSEAREALAQGLASRVDALQSRTADAVAAHDQVLGAAGARLEALESRFAAVDRLAGELEVLRDTLVKDLEQLRVGALAHDQLAGELTRRLSALDGRLARLDSVPGEVQSLRTAMLQEAERSVTSLRALDDRIGQLSWVPGEFQEARKRIMALTSNLQADQDRLRQLEGAVAASNERLDALGARLSAAQPPRPPG